MVLKKSLQWQKLKELKWYAKNILPNYKKRKTNNKKNPIKVGKKSVTTYRFGCKDYTKNFRPEKLNIVLFVDLINQDS